jgi:hypothetical protein
MAAESKGRQRRCRAACDKQSIAMRAPAQDDNKNSVNWFTNLAMAWKRDRPAPLSDS